MRRWRPLIVPGLGLILLLGLDLWVDRRHRQGSTPPEAAQTLQTFAAAMPPAQHLQSFQKEGKTFLLWAGSDSPWYLLNSGPPTYVFDENGRLVDWTPNRGDAPDFDARWGWPQDPWITLEQALSKFKPKGP